MSLTNRKVKEYNSEHKPEEEKAMENSDGFG